MPKLYPNLFGAEYQPDYMYSAMLLKLDMARKPVCSLLPIASDEQQSLKNRVIPVRPSLDTQ